MNTRELRRDQLFDYLVDHPKGVTLRMIMAVLRCSRRMAENAIHDLRLWCDEVEDTINLVCDNDGIGPGIYRLVGRVEEMMPWYSQRTRSVETQLTTMKAVTSSIARGADGRTVEGRKARRIRDGVSDILRDLKWIDEMAGDS